MNEERKRKEAAKADTLPLERMKYYFINKQQIKYMYFYSIREPNTPLKKRALLSLRHFLF